MGQFCGLDISEVLSNFFCGQGKSGVRFSLTMTFQLQVVYLAECGVCLVQGKDNHWEICGKSDHKSNKLGFLFALFRNLVNGDFKPSSPKQL